MHLLIVEDNADSAWIMGRLMSALSVVEVETVGDGRAALNRMAEYSPHIVMLDIGLPGMDGFCVAREIRAQPKFDDVLLVAVTGYGRDEDRKQSAEAGFDVHLLKPAGVEDLRALLTHAKVLARLEAERSTLRSSPA